MVKVISRNIILFVIACFFILKAQAQLGFCSGNSGDPIFIEDFGTGTTNNSLPTGTTTYTYSSGFPNDGEYTVRNSTVGNSFTWHETSDHTVGDVNGKSLIVNAAAAAGEFYSTTVSGLCEGTTYEFSAWVLNLVKAGGFCTSPIPINVKFEIWDSTDTNILASGDTGNIGAGSSPNWEAYGLVFQTETGQNSVILKMINNGIGGCGNDLAIDDIEFKSCGDIVTVMDTDSADSVSLCSSQAPYDSAITASPDSSVYSSHFYQWQESTDGGVSWNDIGGETNATLSISVNTTTVFRAKIAEVALNLVNDKCVSFSNEYAVNITQLPAKPSLACWENATINTTTCSWDVTGTKPVQPATECYETATFNTTTCSWDISGTQPMPPTGLACYETATFNDTTCSWDVINSTPVLILECYESVMGFNSATCSWNIVGTKPAAPAAECYKTATFNSTTCSWDITRIINGPVYDEDLYICNGGTLVLTPQTSLLNPRYRWDTGEVTDEITVSSAGVYTVDIVGDGCILETRVFNVLEAQYPIIDTIISDENDIIITSTNIEDVLYSIDGINFQSSNTFYDVKGGLYTISVKEQNCDYMVSLEHFHFYIPKYFTPNNDGVHDTFDLAGIERYSSSEVSIYDRYGKLLKFSKNAPFKWDGTFNNQELPTNDYWYVVIVEGKRLTGHFTLKR